MSLSPITLEETKRRLLFYLLGYIRDMLYYSGKTSRLSFDEAGLLIENNTISMSEIITQLNECGKDNIRQKELSNYYKRKGATIES